MLDKELKYKLLDNCKKYPLLNSFLSKKDNANLVEEVFKNPSLTSRPAAAGLQFSQWVGHYCLLLQV